MNTFIEDLAFSLVKEKAPSLISQAGRFELIKNEAKSRQGFSDIVFSANPSTYRLGSASLISIFSVKSGGKLEYVTIPSRYADKLSDIGFSAISSDPEHLRLTTEQFSAFAEQACFSEIIGEIIFGSFSGSNFGCCSRYKECSAVKHCVHPDIFYAAAACEYKRHLDRGNNFLQSDK